ncbi:MAG TPA: aromatic amino acid transport family protein [Coxiellaceae bacterium]|nr:aromatic amino acid transport family protein [Coxiellaceae bacterium]
MGKQFGAIYLILGTCVAAGMLGLPVVTATHQFSMTLIMILSAWVLMTAGAWCLLQVTLTMPANANLISMSQQTLGPIVKWLTWCIYLLLLYSLICAYLAAASDLLQHLCQRFHIIISSWLSTIIAVLILGGIVTHGIRSVDLTNRVLVSVKLIIALLVIISVIPFVYPHQLMLGNTHWDNSAWLVIICAFGYAIILPSIRDYLGNDKKKLTRVIMIGSFLPAILYITWIAVVQGALDRAALVIMNHSSHTNSLLMTNLADLTHHTIVKSMSVIFIYICSITGFLGVSICLIDFLADGTRIKKQGKNKLLLAAIAFLPPTIIVILDPSIFIRALTYAGFFCLYILIALPIVMYVRMMIDDRSANKRTTP